MEKYYVIVDLKNNMYVFYNWSESKFETTFNIGDAKRMDDEGEVLETLKELKENKDPWRSGESYYEVRTIYKF